MKQFGFVYLLGNHWMPDLYKIGCTERSPHKRAAELSDHTGVPEAFDVLCYIEVEDFQAVERRFHALFSGERINTGREFFHSEDLGRFVGAFLRYDGALAFTDCDASSWLASDAVVLADCPNPWGAEQVAAPSSASSFDDFPDDLPWETPALKVVEGGKGA